MHEQIRLNPPITEENIFDLFRREGYSPNGLINKQKMKEIFAKQCKHKKLGNFSDQLTEEIWDQSETTTKGQISIRTLSEIILEAQKILTHRIQELSRPEGMIDSVNNKIKQKQQQLDQFTKYYGQDRIKLNMLTKELINMQIQVKQHHNDLQSFLNDYQSINGVFVQQQAPIYLSQHQQPAKVQPLNIKKEDKLLTLFHLTNVILALQFLIVSSLRISMVAMTSVLHSYYLLFFGFKQIPDYTYILLHYLLSILLDIAFLILTVKNNSLIMPFKHSSSSIYIVILDILVLVSVGIRLLSLFLFNLLRSNHNPSISNYFDLIGQIFPPQSIKIVENQRIPYKSQRNDFITHDISQVVPYQQDFRERDSKNL